MGKSNRVLQVANIHRSIQFYTDILGLKVVNLTEDPVNRLTWATLAPDEDVTEPVLGLSQQWTGLPSGFSPHERNIQIRITDLDQACENSKYFGGEVIRCGSTHAMIKDPDGYFVDLRLVRPQQLRKAA